MAVTTPFSYGPISTSVKHQVSGKQWNKLTKAAHAQGNTIESYLNPSIPRPLKERTPQSLRAQANTTISQSYAPAEKTLSDNESRIKAIDDKRKTDLNYYNQWLTDQNAKLDAAARTSDATLGTTLSSIQGDIHSGAQAVKGQVLSNVQNAPGTVTTNVAAQATQPGLLDAAEQRASEQIGARQTAGAYGVNQAEGDRQIGAAANFATIAAQNAKRIGDTWTALQGVADDRGKLVLSKAADAAKEVNRLLDAEVTKAQSNRDYGLLQNKLQSQQQQFNTTAYLKKLGISTSAKTAAGAQATSRRGQDLTNAAALTRINAQAIRDANNQSFKDSQFSARYGISRSTWNAFDDKQKQDYLKSAHKQGILAGGKNAKNASGRTGKEKITQDNYDKAFSRIASSTMPVTLRDHNKKPVIDANGNKKQTDAPLTRNYAQRHHNSLVRLLVGQGYHRSVADAAVKQFELSGGSGSDAGLLHNWLHPDPHANQAH
jgi:hypothetical protein